MAVPSEESFEKAISLLNNLNANELLGEVHNLAPNYDDVYKFLTKCNKARNKKIKVIKETELWIWLESQRGWELGKKAAFKSASKSKKDFVADETETLLKHFRPATKENELSKHLFPESGDEITDFELELYNSKGSIAYGIFYGMVGSKVAENPLMLIADIAKSLMLYFFGEPLKELVSFRERERELSLHACNAISVMV